MGIKDLISKWRESNKYYEEMEMQDKAQSKIITKKKSSNERELDKYMKEMREQKIKDQVEKIRKQKSNEYWHKDIISQPNIFTNNRNLFSGSAEVLKG